MGFAEIALIVAGVITFLAIVGYLLMGGFYRAFLRVGFTPGEAGLILLGTFLGAGIDIPFLRTNGWLLAINVGGAIVPIVVTFILLRRRPDVIVELIAATTAVAATTYFVTSVTEFGISSPFPLYLLPPIVAALMSLAAFWREETFAAPLAYMAGTLGAIIGADVFRLPEALARPVPDGSSGVASIGGAAALDMVYLTGILAVTLDMLVFHQVHRRKANAQLAYDEGLVFTTSTPSEVIASYRPQVPGARPPPPEPPRKDRVRAPPRPPTPARPRAPPTATTAPPTGSAEEDRLAAHRAWEERVRGRR